MRLALLLAAAAFLLVLRRFREDARRWEALVDDDEWMYELVPMAASLPVASRN